MSCYLACTCYTLLLKLVSISSYTAGMYMGLFKKIKTLMGSVETATTQLPEDVDEFSPAALDNPPQYTFVNALYAARQGNAKRVQEYLTFNPKYVHCKNWDDCMLLHEAVRYARIEVVKLLLSNGADVNAPYKGKSPLHLAIEGGAQDVATGNERSTPEQLLDDRRRRKETLKLLLQHQADLTQSNAADELPLHFAARLGYSELVELLLAHGASIDGQIEPRDSNATNGGRTALLLVAKHNKDKKTLKLLLSKGANPNIKDRNPGYTALHYIAAHHTPNQNVTENDLKELAKMLIEARADVSAYTNDGEQQMPLHLAIIDHHLGVIAVLLDHGADVHAKSGNGLLPMGLAARLGDAEVVNYLLGRGADIYKSRALFHAASCKHSDEVLRLLLDKGIDINMPDPNGYTPIFSAISAYSLTNVKLLLEKGIDVRQHSPKGLTVLEHAFACWGEVECVSDDEISEERRRDADNARDIIQILGGFDRPEKKLFM